MSRPQYLVEAVESEETWILTTGTSSGVLVQEVDKTVSFVILFDRAQAAIANLTGQPADSFDLRFRLPRLSDSGDPSR